VLAAPLVGAIDGTAAVQRAWGAAVIFGNAAADDFVRDAAPTSKITAIVQRGTYRKDPTRRKITKVSIFSQRSRRNPSDR
jgi:hypothetical protein